MYKISNLKISIPNYFLLSRSLLQVSLSVWALYGVHTEEFGSNIPTVSDYSV